MSAESSSDRRPLGRVFARLARLVERGLVSSGLSLAQYRVLAFLAEERSAAAASKLADRMSVTRPTITALIDGLVAKGLVTRDPVPSDRRRVSVALTPEGRRCLTTADRGIDAQLAVLTKHLDPAEHAVAIAGAERWGDALDRALLALMESQRGSRP
ncbi:MAG: MarR family transcriptional regulator [Acidimicrobiales bacterium]|nr:MarR family transcriptional regulator [Acidimicrobiales bacterium]